MSATCRHCGATFSWLTALGRRECRFHPGQRRYSPIGDVFSCCRVPCDLADNAPNGRVPHPLSRIDINGCTRTDHLTTAETPSDTVFAVAAAAVAAGATPATVDEMKACGWLVPKLLQSPLFYAALPPAVQDRIAQELGQAIDMSWMPGSMQKEYQLTGLLPSLVPRPSASASATKAPELDGQRNVALGLPWSGPTPEMVARGLVLEKIITVDDIPAVLTLYKVSRSDTAPRPSALRNANSYLALRGIETDQ